MQITYAPGPESVASAWLALQRALPQLDRRFGFLFWWEQGQLRLEVRGMELCCRCRNATTLQHMACIDSCRR